MTISAEKKDVKSVFDDFGQTVTFLTRTIGVFNEISGNYEGNTTVTHSMKGIVSKQLYRNFPGILANTTDKVVFIYADDTYVPKLTDKLVLTTGQKEINIKQVDEYKLKDEVIAYRLSVDR